MQEIELPALPELNPAVMTRRMQALDGLVDMETVTPTQSVYQCSDPNAPALVCVPGLGADGFSFINQLPLGAVGAFHAIQAPNDPVKGETGLGHFSRYVEAYIETLKLHQRPGGVVLMGTSMGGAVSLDVAVRGRVPIRGLVLVGTYGSCKHLSWVQRVAWPLGWVIPARLANAVGRFVIQSTKMFSDFKKDEAKFLVGDGVRIRSRGYLGRAARALTSLALIEPARALSIPTLVQHARDDKVLPYAAGQELAEAIPGARLDTYEDGGHAFFIVRPKAVNQAIAQFLAQLPEQK